VRRPEETAISIAAEIIALQERRRGGQLTENDLPVHSARPPASTIS
jgi:xanthine/CO dehydrogenase XdhC/CoxF family maturation factor